MSTTWSAQIGREVQRQRERAGLKFNSLSEKTRELGRPVHRVALPKIESGERDISIGELVSIAVALDISPLALILPNVLEDVQVLPDVTAAGIDVFGWWTGVGGPTRSVRGLFAKNDGLRVASQLADVEIALRLHRLNLKRLERDYGVFERDSDREEVERAQDRVSRMEAERNRLVDAYKNAIEDGSPDA